MKTRFLIIIGIGVAIAITITITITVGLEFYQQEYEKNCLEKNGKITGFLSCFNIHQDFVGPKIEANLQRKSVLLLEIIVLLTIGATFKKTVLSWWQLQAGMQTQIQKNLLSLPSKMTP